LPSELFSLTSLLQLDLNNNTLSGTIDGMQNLQSLEFLQLHQNLFSGTIPVGVSELVNLTVMTTYDTHLQ
jgi:Leucine-rich repeat (LRR) protein